MSTGHKMKQLIPILVVDSIGIAPLALFLIGGVHPKYLPMLVGYLFVLNCCLWYYFQRPIPQTRWWRVIVRWSGLSTLVIAVPTLLLVAQKSMKPLDFVTALYAAILSSVSLYVANRKT